MSCESPFLLTKVMSDFMKRLVSSFLGLKNKLRSVECVCVDQC